MYNRFNGQYIVFIIAYNERYRWFHARAGSFEFCGPFRGHKENIRQLDALGKEDAEQFIKMDNEMKMND